MVIPSSASSPKPTQASTPQCLSQADHVLAAISQVSDQRCISPIPRLMKSKARPGRQTPMAAGQVLPDAFMNMAVMNQLGDGFHASIQSLSGVAYLEGWFLAWQDKKEGRRRNQPIKALHLIRSWGGRLDGRQLAEEDDTTSGGAHSLLLVLDIGWIACKGCHYF